MNRKEALAGGGRNGTVGSASLLLQQRRVRAGVVAASGKEGGGDEGLDLFSKHRRILPVVPVSAEVELDNRNGPPKLGNTSVVSDKVQRSGMDDMFFGANIGKHDYDWLLTPPGTPLNSSLDVREHQLSSLAPKSTSLSRPVATAKASRFSLSLLENNHSAKPARSSSSTRPSISSTYSGHLSNNTSRTSILDTSTASITSYRPSTPTKRLTATTTTSKQTTTTTSKQTTTPTSRTSSRSSTPVKTRPSPSSPANKIPTSADKPRSLHGTRLSTATSRQHVSSDLSSSSSTIANRKLSRSSTPTQRTIASFPTNTVPASTRPLNSSRPSTPTTRRTVTASATVPTRSSSVGRVPAASVRNSGPSSRPSSPSPRTGTPAKPIVLPDLPHYAPPNLRTKLPDRPLSAGRTRPGSALGVRADVNSDPSALVNSSRRQSCSPVVTRGRLPENSTKTQLKSNGHRTDTPEKQVVSHNTVRKLAKPATTTESTGFGRTISKKSLDMALRHMDIRQGIGGIRGSSLFPQSIRSTAKKGYPGRMSDPVVPVSRSGTDTEDTECGISISDSYNGGISENGHSITTSPDRNFMKKATAPDTRYDSPDRNFMKKATAPDVYESTRYDSILLKEDSKNMNWLHSVEDKSDQSPVFGHRFEPPPEPFALP